MAHLYGDVDEISPYLKARKKFYSQQNWNKMINALKTVLFIYFFFVFFDDIIGLKIEYNIIYR